MAALLMVYEHELHNALLLWTMFFIGYAIFVYFTRKSLKINTDSLGADLVFNKG